jgi:hypothetical protein
MGLLDAPLRAVSKNLMAKFGTSCTIRSVTHGAYSATAGKSVESVLDTATRGVLEEYRAHEFGDTVKVGDRKLTVAASELAFTPDTEDRVLIGSTLYRVIRVETVQATDEAALYQFQIRGNA